MKKFVLQNLSAIMTTTIAIPAGYLLMLEYAIPHLHVEDDPWYEAVLCAIGSGVAWTLSLFVVFTIENLIAARKRRL